MSMTDVSPSLALEPAHTRCLDIALSQSTQDGAAGANASIVFRADLLDLRKSGLMELAGRIATAGIIHNMSLMGRYDAITGEIQQLDWHQSHVMHEANRATQGECCRDPMDRLRALVGTRLGQGFRSDLKQCFGGPLGCTHINTLFQELSATVGRRARLVRENPDLAGPRVDGERLTRRSVFFDAFLPAESPRSSLKVRFMEAHYGRATPTGEERLQCHDEVRLGAEVDLAGWQLAQLRARVRQRSAPDFEDAPWVDRSEELVDFSGRSLGGGMGRYCSDRFGAEPEDDCLLSSLLCLAPGMTQVGAALSNSLAPSPIARPQGSGSPLAGPGPCYMLRGDGPLARSIQSGHGPSED
jgi:hypothetical protein